MKQEEKKPYCFPDLEKRSTMHLKLDHNNKDQYVVKYFLDDMLMFNIWCDRITVYATKPPTWCLYAKGLYILGVPARMMTIDPEVQDIAQDATIAALGSKYVRIGKEGIG